MYHILMQPARYRLLNLLYTVGEYYWSITVRHFQVYLCRLYTFTTWHGPHFTVCPRRYSSIMYLPDHGHRSSSLEFQTGAIHARCMNHDVWTIILRLSPQRAS